MEESKYQKKKSFLPLGLPSNVSLKGFVNPTAASGAAQLTGSLLDLSVDRGAPQHMPRAGRLQDLELLPAR